MSEKRVWPVTRRDMIAGLAGAAGATLISRFGLPSSERAAYRFLEKNPQFLVDHPDLVEASASVAESHRLAEKASERRALIAGKWASTLHASFSPCLGPLNGTLGLIEITDYLCAPCRGSTIPIGKALAAYPDRQVIILFVPISGALSEFAAAFATACYFINPVAFARLHGDLMEGSAPDQALIEKYARARGFDVDAVVREMESPRVGRYLIAARSIAEELGLTGVPAFLNPRGELQLGGIDQARAVAMIGPTSDVSSK